MKYFIIFIICCLMTACHKPTQIQIELTKAENMIDSEKYQEALKLLDSIQLLKNKNRADEALTNLLWIQSKDKLDEYIYAPDSDKKDWGAYLQSFCEKDVVS